MVEWIDVVQKLGIPFAILVFLGVCAWKSGKWFGMEIIIPARDLFFGRITEAFKHINDTLSAIQQTLTHQTETLSIMRTAAQATTKTAVAGAKAMERVVNRTEESHSLSGE